jgi:carboxypeptidase PM20D1
VRLLLFWCVKACDGRTVRKALGVLFLAVVAIGAVMAVNAFRRGPSPRATAVVAPVQDIDERAVAEHLAAAIRFRTVSHEDPKEDDRSTFAELRKFLAATYQRVHVGMVHEVINGDGLLYRWPGSNAAAEPIVFLAHQDVVPIEPGTESKWTHPPFDGVIADGFVWGRGAIDDKGSLICLFEAFESLLAEGFAPERTIWFASGFDEEVGGRQGAKKIAEELRERGIRFAWLLDEGGVISEGIVPTCSGRWRRSSSPKRATFRWSSLPPPKVGTRRCRRGKRRSAFLRRPLTAYRKTRFPRA